ncbi:MAG TPA: signal peptidase II [Thermoanaerobaculia bacterium]|nr:signal peptidase II [Thermoanaerobaculia bacterium]
MPRRLVYFGISLAVVVLDQITKAIVAARIPLHDTIPVIRGFFDLTHVKNTGAAFGLFASLSSPARATILTFVAAGVFLAVLAWSLTSPVTFTRLQTALALVLGGAVGNLIDRVRFRSVTDFLRFYVDRLEWPSFNVADSAISVGVVLLAWNIWRDPQKEPATCTQS